MAVRRFENRQRQALKDVSSALTSRVDLSTILSSIVDGIANSLNVASAIVLFDQHEDILYLAAQSGLDAAVLQKLVSRRACLTDQSIIGCALRRQQPCVSQDISQDERFPSSRNFGIELGLRSIFSYPLVTGATVYGVLLLCSTEAGGFTPLKSDILSLFASQATIAIHNGKLLESAHQRSQFQDAIEQLEHVYQRRGDQNGETSLQDEQQLFQRLHETAQQTFGVSLTSLMRFISDHLLTRNERNLHDALLKAAGEGDGHELELSVESEQFDSSIDAQAAIDTLHDKQQLAQRGDALERTLRAVSSPQEGIALLTRTAEEALARADVLSELSRLLIQLQQSTGHIQDAWFAIDLNGVCFSMNPAAKSFSNMRLTTPSTLSLDDIFAELLLRMRNVDEVSAYLQSFPFSSLGGDQAPICHCVLAMEPIPGRGRVQRREDETGAMPELFSALQIEDIDEADRFMPRSEAVSLQLNSAPSDHHYQMTRYPLHNREGQLMAYGLQIHDITEQVRDEKNKSVLLSSVSHDLRTPLTTIKAAVTGLLQDDVVWDEQVRQEILQDIDVETDHLTDLVDAIVEMSRIEMGALALEKEWCDVVEVAHGALARLDRVPTANTVKIIIQPQLPLVYADHVHLGRVFYRLLEYAAHHSPAGSEISMMLDTIESRPLSELAPVPLLRVQVIDHGSGVPETERERIFKTFYSLSPLGNGLGLAICKGIIEAHHGRIWVEPLLKGAEDGSRFIFTLPISPYRSDARVSRLSTGLSSFAAYQASSEETR